MTRFIAMTRWGQYKGELRAFRAERTRATDGTDELKLSTVESLEKGDRVVFVDSMGRACEYSAEQPQTERADRRGGCTTRCKGSMLADLALKKVEDTEISSCTASQALSAALAGTGWKVGHVDAGNGAQKVMWHEMSAIEAVKNACEIFGLEVEQRIQIDGPRVAGRYVDLFNRRGRDTTRRFEYGRDLRGIRRTVSSTPVYTRLYCYGKTLQGDENKTAGGYSKRVDITSVNGGKPYVEDAEATAIWGLPDGEGGKIPAEGIYENGDCEDPEQLLAEGESELAKRTTPEVSYEADVVSLSRAGFDADGVDVGDGVQIVDTMFPGTVRLEGRVLEISENLLGGLSDTTITLGNISKTLTQANAEAQAAIDRLTGSAGAWDSAATVQDSFINSVINGVNSVLNEIGGYSYLIPGKGLYVYDRPIDDDPTMVIAIGGGYMRIADSKNSQGEWNWRTAAMGHGLVADELVVGVITGGANSWDLETGDLLFQQGGIRDSKGYNSWNLTTGDFTLSSGVTVGGKTVGAIADEAADSALNSANAYTDALDEELDAVGVFNRLTDNGSIRGIYMRDGQLYINASYILSGIINANLIRAGVISDATGKNKWDLTTGNMTLSGNLTVNGGKIMDSSGRNVWDLLGDLMEIGNPSTTINAGIIQGKGGNYWNLNTGEMSLDFSAMEDELDSAVSSLSSRITTAQTTANSAKSAASTAQSTANSAQSTANSANTKATSAKAKTDRITFTSSGINVIGTNGSTATCMTYGPGGIVSAGALSEIRTNQGTMGVKDWGFSFINASGTVGIWVTAGADEGGTGEPNFTARFPGGSIIVGPEGGTINGKKILTE